MYPSYDLTALYTSYEDKNYQNDLQALTILHDQVVQLEKAHTIPYLKHVISLKEQYSEKTSKLAAFIRLNRSIDSTSKIHSNQFDRLNYITASHTKTFSNVDQYIASFPNLLDIIQQDEKLSQYSFYFKLLIENNQYALTDEMEEVIAKLSQTGVEAWRNLHSYLNATLTTRFNNQTYTLSEIRNLAYNKDPNVRKQAYIEELNMYEQVATPIAFALNNVKKTTLINNELRNAGTPIEATLRMNRMQKSTLDALISSIEHYLPQFRKYLKHKAKLLGHHGGLPFYDLFAPIQTTHQKYTIEQSKQFLLNCFATFSNELVQLTKRAYDEKWIDFEARVGKVGGAFCSNLPFIKQSRILTNYDGTLSDIVTIAHELGHAYHGHMIENHLPLNRSYTMPLAETASIFNEHIVMEAILQQATKEEKIALIESQLQDVTQIIVDIYSRFIFEKNVFERKENEFLFAEDFKEMMLQAQRCAYKDGLDHDYLHPYMWINKVHYYYFPLNFYNFPYAFGGLFAKGLYNTFKTEGKTFLEKYHALLYATTTHTVEEVALKANIDVTNQTFWMDTLQSYSDLIEQWIAYTS